ncbi:MAG: ornithine cyclodeaminase family protein [Gaiellaceae bacterium]
MSIPFLAARHVEAAVSPAEAVEAVRDAFAAYARGEWTMPPKVYVPAYPAGDFRAMPALGAGHALLKWVTSFPGNPARGLPTVTGLVLLSDASDGSLKAVLDTGVVTALRTGAAAVLAAETLGRDESSATVVGVGVNGRAAARTFLARGRDVVLWDVDSERARSAARELGARVAASREEALGADLVVTVTPGHQVLFAEGSLRAGQHVSLMGADGPGKSEIALAELARVHAFCDNWEKHGPFPIPGHRRHLGPPVITDARGRLVCDDWQQASHGGDLARAVAESLISREDVATLGDILIGAAPGRQSDGDITVFDSTGLAIQDLAVALAAYERYRAEPNSPDYTDVIGFELD